MIGNTRRSVKLGDLFTIKHGYAFKGKHFCKEGSHIVLTPGNFFDEGGFKQKGDKEKWYSGEIPEGYILSKGDIIVAMTEQAEGLLGSAAIIPQDNLYLHNQRLGLIQNLNGVDKKYLYYIFNIRLVRQQIRASCSGVKVRHTSPSRIYEVKVDIPPLLTQRKIVEIVAPYDELIENNLRRIKILEEMAQALYREWFVKFRFPGHEKVRMIDSSLGQIPEGWRISKISDLVKICSGYAFKSKTFVKSANYKVITIKNVKDGEFINESESQIEEIPSNMPNHCVLSTGDILLSLTGNIGRVCLVYGSNFLLNQRVAKLVPYNMRNRGYLYFMFREEELQKRLEMISTGVAQQNLSPVQMGELKILVPLENLINKFTLQANSTCDLINNLNLRNKILRSSRDLLLPKLISGQLDVSNLAISMAEER